MLNIEDDRFNTTISFEVLPQIDYSVLYLYGEDSERSQGYYFQATEKDADKAIMIANALTSWAGHVKNVLVKKEKEQNMENEFKQYRRKQIAELCPYKDGFDLEGVSISQVDKEAGSPKEGDMIARNPKNHADKWLVAAQYFYDNFEPIESK